MGIVLNWSSNYPTTIDTIGANFPELTDGVHDVIVTHVNTIAQVVVALENVVGGLRNAPIQEPLSVSDGQLLVWSDINSQFEAADEVGVGLQYAVQGANLVIQDTPNAELVVGGFPFNPSLFTGAFTISFEFYGILQTAGGLGSLSMRLYDMGAPGSPEAGTLVATLAVPNDEKGSNVKKTLSLNPVVTPSLLNEIYNAPRMYELRLVLAGGSIGDYATNLWSGIKVL